MAVFKYLFLVLLCAMAEMAVAQNWVSGYYITEQGDSILTNIKIPTVLFRGFDPQQLQHRIKTRMDDSLSSQRFNPSEVKRFGFDYKNEQFTFISITLDSRSKRFFRIIGAENHVAGYYFYSISVHGASTVAVRKHIDGEQTLILKSSSMSKKKIRQKLMDYYSADGNAISIIQHSDLSLRDLPGSVKHIMEKIAAAGSGKV